MSVAQLIDFGAQALCNRFPASRDADEATFKLAVGHCRACGIVQLISPPRAAELKPRVNWISYREAEGHLDELVDDLLRLPGISSGSVVAGISSKDDSTLERLRNRGLSNTWRISIGEDLATEDEGAGPETVQQHLTPNTAESIARRRGKADILVVRHIIEHAHEPSRFISALCNLIKPHGYIVLEMPDCEPALRRLDYTMPWEEHVLYFTAELLKRAIAIWGLVTRQFRLFHYHHENSLVAIVHADDTVPRAVPERCDSVLALGELYARSFSPYRRAANEALAEFRANRGHIAMFGAGHLSSAWINFLDAGRHLEFVVDDDPNKRGLFMPGSRLPIFPSTELTARGIKLCLMSLNQESEAKVIAKNRAFVEQGGYFASIFPERPNSFPASTETSSSLPSENA